MAPSDPNTDEFLAHIRRHQGILYKVSRSYAQGPDDRKDLEQDMLTQLWRAWPRYDPQRKFSTWMYRVALNVAISHSRKAQRRPEIRVDGPSDWPGERDHADQRENLAELRRFLAGLDELHRALMLMYLDGFNQADIGATLGISESNVATKIYRIKQQLKQHFNT